MDPCAVHFILIGVKGWKAEYYCSILIRVERWRAG
jgi:hypothetical protein